MQLVTHAPAAMLEQDQAHGLLLDMAAVTRTIFGVQRPAVAAQPAPAAEVVVAATEDTAAFPGASVSTVAATTPSLQVPALQVPSLSLPVPALAVPTVPVAAPDHGDPEERHSLALLQEIAFLDE